jgi:hypothetical protein
MRQVFFKTGIGALQAAGTAGDDRFSDLSTAGTLGFWNLDATTGGAWFTDRLFNNDVEAGTDTDTGDITTLSHGYMLKKSLQVVQGYGGNNPIASPIIDTRNITRIACAGYVNTTQYAVTYTPDTTNEGDGDEVQLKFVIRTSPSDYLNFVNGETAFADLGGNGFQFPLGAHNTTNHKIINISFTGTGTDTTTCDNVRTAIQNHSVLNALISLNAAGSGTAVMTARHAGVTFEVIGENLTDDVAVTAGDFAITEFVPGVGNAWQARADELKARSYAGNFNRMYFPDSFTNFVTSASAEYDRFEITYKIDGNRDVVKGSQYGTVVIYELNGGNKVGLVLNDGTADVAATKVEYLF